MVRGRYDWNKNFGTPADPPFLDLRAAVPVHRGGGIPRAMPRAARQLGWPNGDAGSAHRSTGGPTTPTPPLQRSTPRRRGAASRQRSGGTPQCERSSARSQPASRLQARASRPGQAVARLLWASAGRCRASRTLSTEPATRRPTRRWPTFLDDDARCGSTCLKEAEVATGRQPARAGRRPDRRRDDRRPGARGPGQLPQSLVDAPGRRQAGGGRPVETIQDFLRFAGVLA